MTGLPPKLRKVDQQTRAGRKEKAVSVKIWVKVSSWAGTSAAVIPKTFRTASWVSRPRRPINRPVATSTGMMGTNTSENIRTARWKALP